MSGLRIIEKKKAHWFWGAWTLLVLAPWIQLAVISLATGKNAFAAFPVWSDELDYWRNLYNWAHVGLPMGYNGILEREALIGTLSVHGLTPLLLYGGFVRLFGLSFHSIVIYNALWISLAALLFCWLVKPRPLISLALAGLLAAFVPSVLYCFTSMTEQFNYALLLFFLAFLLHRRQDGSRWALAFGWITAAVACLYRVTFFVLFIPLVWESCGRRFGKKAIGFGVLALALIGGIYAASAQVTAPYPAGFLYNWLRAPDPGTFFRMFFSHAKAKLYDYFIRPTGSPMEDALRWMYIPATGLCLLLSFLRLQWKGRPGIRLGMDWMMLCSFMMLFIPFSVVVMIYETNDWADFRTLAPFLWGVAAAFIVARRKLIPTIVLAGSAVTLILLFTLPPTGAFKDENRFVPEAYSAELAEACATLVYDSAAEDLWANTIRTDMNSLQVLTEVPPGMGLMYGWFTPESTGKSRWILTDHLKIVVEGYEPIKTLHGVKIYRHMRE